MRRWLLGAALTVMGGVAAALGWFAIDLANDPRHGVVRVTVVAVAVFAVGAAVAAACVDVDEDDER